MSIAPLNALEFRYLRIHDSLVFDVKDSFFSKLTGRVTLHDLYFRHTYPFNLKWNFGFVFRGLDGGRRQLHFASFKVVKS
jgi:hypothetical protein